MGTSLRTWLAAAATVTLAVTGCSGEHPAAVSRTTEAAASSRNHGPTSLRFIVASDTHVGDPGTGSASATRRFVKAVDALNRTRHLDFVVVNGDLAHDSADLPKVKALLDGLDVPYLPVPGNHDHATPTGWREVFGRPESSVAMVEGYGIVLANTSNSDGDYLCTDDGALRSALRRTDAASGALVFFHITPRRWTRYGVDCPAVRATLSEHPNVRAVFNGHDHDQVGEKVDAGVHYFFDGHVGGHWGTPHPTFRLVEVYGTALATEVVDLTTGAAGPRTRLTWR